MKVFQFLVYVLKSVSLMVRTHKKWYDIRTRQREWWDRLPIITFKSLFINFPSQLQFPLPPFLCHPPPLTPPFSLQKMTGLQWISTNHGIASCRKSNHLVLWFLCPSYRLCWGKGSTKTVGVANQRLLQPQIHARRVSLPLTLPGVPGPRG